MSHPSRPFAALAAALLTAALPTAALPAQDPAPPAVEALLDRVEAVLGPPRAALRVAGTYSVRFEGAAGDQPVARGRFHEHFAGRRARHRSDMGEFGALERGCTEDVVWEVDPTMGARVYRGTYAAAVRRFYAIVAGASPRRLYETIEPAGTAEIGGATLTRLRATPAEGAPDTWFVDAEGRVVRIDTALPAPESAPEGSGPDDLMPATLTFDDWREVGDGRLPHERTLAMGPAIVSFVCDDVAVPERIADETFTPPAAVAEAAAEPVAAGAAADDGTVYRVVDKAAQPVASIRFRCKPDEISQQLAVVLPEVMAHLNATGAKMAGAPFSRYHAWGPDQLDIEAGIPVQAPIEEKGRVKNSELPAGRTVTCWHVGPYEKLSVAHAGLMAHVRAQEFVPRGGPWEVYWTDPGMVPDPTKWRTQLFQPVR